MVNGTSSKLKFDFIDLAFALAIGQVGEEIGDFYTNGNSFFQYPYVFTHLFLCVYIIASSWVGWNISESKGNRANLSSVFSISFFVLLIDLLCVFCYFIMVKGVEKPNHTIVGGDKITPDCHVEIKWTAIIFILYMIWDFFTKFLTDDIKRKIDYYYEKRWKYLKLYLKKYVGRAWQSLMCLSITSIFFYGFKNAHNSLTVILTDIALTFIFVLFRGAKSIMAFYDKRGRIWNIEFYDSLKFIMIPAFIIIVCLVTNFYNNYV